MQQKHFTIFNADLCKIWFTIIQEIEEEGPNSSLKNEKFYLLRRIIVERL